MVSIWDSPSLSFERQRLSFARQAAPELAKNMIRHRTPAAKSKACQEARVKKYTLDHTEQGQCNYKARAITQSKDKTSLGYLLLLMAKVSTLLSTTTKWVLACKFQALWKIVKAKRTLVTTSRWLEKGSAKVKGRKSLSLTRYSRRCTMS